MAKNIFHIGTANNGSRVYLTDDDLKTSVHISGLSQSGKSSFIVSLCMQMIRMNVGFFEFDPHWLAILLLLKFQCALRYKSKDTAL